MTATIEIKQTWQNTAPMLAVLLVNGTIEGQDTARAELQRMAKGADMANDLARDLKASLALVSDCADLLRDALATTGPIDRPAARAMLARLTAATAKKGA